MYLHPLPSPSSSLPSILPLPSTSSVALLSFYVILSCSMALASILATFFHTFPSPTNVSMYLFTVFGMAYGIGAFWEYTLPGVKPPGEGQCAWLCSLITAGRHWLWWGSELSCFCLR